MIPEEVDALFTTHSEFIANTRILSFAPLVKISTYSGRNTLPTMQRRLRGQHENGQHLWGIKMVQARNVRSKMAPISGKQENCWFPSSIWRRHAQPWGSTTRVLLLSANGKQRSPTRSIRLIQQKSAFRPQWQQTIWRTSKNWAPHQYGPQLQHQSALQHRQYQHTQLQLSLTWHIHTSTHQRSTRNPLTSHKGDQKFRYT